MAKNNFYFYMYTDFSSINKHAVNILVFIVESSNKYNYWVTKNLSILFPI